MSIELELPSELTPETDILVIQPFTDEEYEEITDEFVTDEEVDAIFQRAANADPSFKNFKLAVYDIAKPLDLKIYALGDSLMILAGDRNALEKAAESLSQKTTYSFYLDTVGGFTEYVEDTAEVSFIPEEKPRLH